MKMPLEPNQHEEYLSKLNDPELSHTERTEILQALRVDYQGVHKDFNDLTETKSKLEKEKSDLVTSNSMLFRKLGESEKPKDEEQEKKTFSETVSLNDIERNQGVR